MSDEKILVTEDRRMRDGITHPVDDKLISQVDLVLSGEEAAERMKAEQDEQASIGVGQVGSNVMPSDAALEEIGPAKHKDFYEYLHTLAAQKSADARIDSWGCIATREDALWIRELRCNKRYSWRMVAEACYEHYHSRMAELGREMWQPRESQVWGMIFCDRAAEILGENYREGDWN